MKYNILAISGTTKSNATNTRLLQYIKHKYADEITVTIYNRIDHLPHFNPDLDGQKLPQEVVDLRKLIEDASGIIFCTPEYVFSLPGALKNIIEWNVSTTLFSSKPVAAIVAAASGEHALSSLKLILRTIEAVLPDESCTLIKGAKSKIDSDGQITDFQTKVKIDIVIKSFLASIESTDKLPTKYL